jgi:hypothetical protein
LPLPASTLALMPAEVRADVKQWVRDFRAIRNVEPSPHVALIGDAVVGGHNLSA